METSASTPGLDPFTRPGVQRGVAGNAPLNLSEVGRIWIVEVGKLDVFAADTAGGHREYLFSANPGAAVLSAGAGDAVHLLATGILDTRVRELELRDLDLDGPVARRAFLSLVTDYVARASSALTHTPPGAADTLLESGRTARLRTGQVALVQRNSVWLDVVQGRVALAGCPDAVLDTESAPCPLGAHAWVEALTDCELRTLAGPPDDGAALLAGTAAWQEAFLAWTVGYLRSVQQRDARRIVDRARADSRSAQSALESLAGVLEETRDERVAPGGRPLRAALDAVGKALGVRFRDLPPSDTSTGTTEEVRSIARASGIGAREVVLDGNWWLEDVGPLLAFRTAGDGDGPPLPVALIPRGPRAYDLLDPVEGRRVPVDRGVASTLAAFGFTFYRSLPAGALRLRDIARFASWGTRQDVRTLVLVGLLGAGLGLAVPIATGFLFDTVIPSADRVQLWHLFGGLVVAALAAATFELTRVFATVRLESRVVPSLQMAVLDRLIHLPSPFFRRYTAGDLGDRAVRVTVIGRQLGGATMTSLLSASVALGAFVLLFYYSPLLALAGTAIVLTVAAATGAAAYYALTHERQMQEEEGRLAGMVLGLLGGIAKLRVSASEARAFAGWAEGFRRQRASRFRVGKLQNWVEVMSAFVSVAALVVIFGLYTRIAQEPGGGISTGRFLAFYAAFGIFLAAGLQIAWIAIALVGVVPAWERATPILTEVPEFDPSNPDPGRLTGRVEASHLTFNYGRDGPAVLNDVSFTAEPGEFIALVGSSGAGKSTLLRLLLGFHRPDAGAVYYDGHDLATVDVTAVRRQIGVVLQTSQVIAGDVFENIVGSSGRSVEEAWEAARMAGMEEDLKAMPMGIHTIVSEGGTNMSGGQRQRILIARALVSRPRILFFDEATSALDNRTQKIVADSVGTLQATRIVIAHRLSTIQNADRIYVLEKGRIVQSGSFEQLLAVPGPFRDQARRQEVES